MAEDPIPEDLTAVLPQISIRDDARTDMLRIVDTRGDIQPLEVIEKEVIIRAIELYHGQMSEVARRLKIGRSTLYRKLERYGLKPADAVVNRLLQTGDAHVSISV